MTLRGQGEVQRLVLEKIEHARQPIDTIALISKVYELDHDEEGYPIIGDSKPVVMRRLLKRLEVEQKIHRIGRNEHNRDMWVTYAKWLELCAAKDITCKICNKLITEGSAYYPTERAHVGCWDKQHGENELTFAYFMNPIRHPDEFRRKMRPKMRAMNRWNDRESAKAVAERAERERIEKAPLCWVCSQKVLDGETTLQLDYLGLGIVHVHDPGCYEAAVQKARAIPVPDDGETPVRFSTRKAPQRIKPAL